MAHKNYQLVELNNKTRKGLYVRHQKKYYKVQPGIPIETIIQYWTTKAKQRKGQKITTLPKPKPKQARRRTIEGQLKKGIKTITTKDLTTNGMNRAKSRLFQKIK